MTAVTEQVATALDRARLLDDERAARLAAEQAQRRLDVLARASEVLSGSLDEPAVLDRLAGLLVPGYTDWLVVLLTDDDDRLEPCLSVHADPAQAAQAAALTTTEPLTLAGGSPAAQVFRSQQPLSTGNVRPYLQQTPGDVAGLAARLEVGAGMLVPMLAQGRSIGVLSLVNSPQRAPIPARDQALILDLAGRAGSALANARLFGQRSQMAQRLQASLLPDRLPDLAGLALAARYLAAEQAAEVGGDFYDAFALTPGAYALVIGDVAGRGVDAAGLTGLARASLRALPADLNPADSLARLNSLLLPRTGPERFVTAAYLRLQLHDDHDDHDDKRSGGRRGGVGLHAVLARAGHPPPLLLRADGTVQPVGVPGPLLGVFDSIDPDQTRLRLDPGDVLLLYTDGVIEAHGPDGLYGEQRLVALLARHAGHSAQEIVDTVHNDVLAYRTGGADDLAVLAVQVLPPTRNIEKP